MATNHITTTNLPDFARHFIGGDPFARFTGMAQNASNYPPYNIEQIGEDEYRLTLAVAGFARSDIDITREKDMLTITGRKPQVEHQGVLVHRGIALRDFERSFLLGDHVVVRGASMADGLLVIDLMREVPEDARAVSIPIG